MTDPVSSYDETTGVATITFDPKDAAAAAAAGISIGDWINTQASILIGLIRGVMTSPVLPINPVPGEPPKPVKP